MQFGGVAEARNRLRLASGTVGEGEKDGFSPRTNLANGIAYSRVVWRAGGRDGLVAERSRSHGVKATDQERGKTGAAAPRRRRPGRTETTRESPDTTGSPNRGESAATPSVDLAQGNERRRSGLCAAPGRRREPRPSPRSPARGASGRAAFFGLDLRLAEPERRPQLRRS